MAEDHVTADPSVIPFTWRFQPYEDQRYWCRCQRCFAALKALEIHMLARSYV